eukprot:CAMPEP_0172390140 /NCGR_PEP_ID=MMETSP1061-20121228/6857_1 /TAXON_ID=37318 /ORGANISM="Pseudo-nitzschia pungens, Strain cf. pungens" /LENGTH=450 /DNA_ID=CAMNT_0013120431 /DNA_START=116 /DNA_END=1468 /DNA_ORIENTATION=+
MSTEGDKKVAAAEDEAAPERYISHLKNEDAFSWIIRWGILFFLFSTFVLLLNADIGSGVTADSVLMQDGEVQEVNQILNVSVISSVGKLWDAKSYPLAIFIAITSIGWPYIKLAMATFAWVMPYTNPRKRELLIEIIDALGKWSFVDIMVLVEIMVAFRSSVVLAPGLSLEIVIVAQWGFYGFVIATMMSLLSTHVILHYHRKVHYHNPESIAGGDAAKNDDENPKAIEEVAANADADPADKNAKAEKAVASIESPRGMKEIGGLSTGFLILALGSLAGSFVFYLAGVLTETFEVTSTRGDVSVSTSYSIASIGMAIPEAYIDSGHTGTRFIQVMWFFLGIAMPLWCSVLFVILYAVPSLSKEMMEYIFTMAEVTFAWSCAEVLLLSTIFAVLQMPIFGAGLVENNCTTCFVITTQILPEFSLLCIGTCLNVAVNVWLYRKTHSILYQTK